MTSKPVFIVATENSAAIPKVLQAFESPAGGLVFCNSFLPPMAKIYTKKIDQVIHVGWAGTVDRCECIVASETLWRNSPFTIDKAQLNNSGVTRVRMVLTPPEHVIASQPQDHLKMVGLRPGSITTTSLALSRDQWRQQLKQSPEKSLNGCYMVCHLMHYTYAHVLNPTR